MHVATDVYKPFENKKGTRGFYTLHQPPFFSNDFLKKFESLAEEGGISNNFVCL